MRPKSVRVFVLSDFLGSKTTGPVGLRQKTTQCQKGRPLSRCHLMERSAKFGSVSHEEKGRSPSPAEMPEKVTHIASIRPKTAVFGKDTKAICNSFSLLV